ncbi:UNVERIFIED_CONTAM: hypothetical protein GTU68_002534 [Idotea baltica]|nr:hypothetical protein [Idotea baltica]
MEEFTQRQKKIGGILQQDLADVLQKAATDGGLRGVIISVSKVNVTTDLSMAKVYLSVFPNKEAKSLLEGIRSNKPLIRHELAQRTRNQLRRMPQLEFFIDDSLEYIDGIERSLKREDNPLDNPDLLGKRKNLKLNFPLYIQQKRYLFSKSSNNAINIMTLIASGGVIIASAALFIVLSVFAGLKDYSLEFSSFVDPDLKLMPSQGKSFLFSEDDITQLKTINGIVSYSKIIEERVIIKTENKNLLATLKGVDSNYLNVTNIDSMIAKGNWISPESNEVVAGSGISYNLSFGILDFRKSLSLYVPKPGKGQVSSLKGAYNSAYVQNVGLFNINEELNNEYIFADINLAKSLLSYNNNQLSALELKLDPNADESEIRAVLETTFSNRFIIKNREQLNDALFKMLNTENLAIYLIFTLVIIIALFNVIGAIIMMILDKKKSLNTLFNLGTEPKTIKSIFFWQGSLMTVVSGIIGVTIGLLIVFLQQSFGLLMLTSELAYPVRLNFFNVLIVLATIFALGIIASRIASQRITKQLIRS